MDTAEIKAELESIEALMVDRGFVNPSAKFSIRFLCDGYSAWIDYRLSKDGDSMSHHCHSAKSPEAAIKELRHYCATTKTPDKMAKEAFCAKLGRLIDEGRKVGIEVEMMNPLTEAMKALSTNILEHIDPANFENEEMPF